MLHGSSKSPVESHCEGKVLNYVVSLKQKVYHLLVAVWLSGSLKLQDRNVIKVVDPQCHIGEPEGLQEDFDRLIGLFTEGRAFVRFVTFISNEVAFSRITS